MSRGKGVNPLFHFEHVDHETVAHRFAGRFATIGGAMGDHH
jgi:hypothetical protein